MTNPWVKGKVWTQVELDEWKIRHDVENAKYREAANNQLKEWVNGNSIHNELSPINGVVDSNDNIVGYSHCEGGECCPDFSCCSGDGWPIEKRQKFVELYSSGNEEAYQAMLFGGLSELVNELPPESGEVYLTGQIGEVIH